MRRVLTTIVCLSLLIGLAACSDEDDAVLIEVEAPSLENLYPDADLTLWAYRMDFRDQASGAGPPTFDLESRVPDAPTLTELVDLHIDDAFESATPLERLYEMQFDGTALTGSEVEGQNLVASFRGLPKPPEEEAKGILDGPVFLSSGIYARTEQFVGLHNDDDSEARWHLLESNLEPGTRFSFQPDASEENVWVHALVLERKDVLTAFGRFDDSIRMLYLMDLGIVDLNVRKGGEPRLARRINYAWVDYVPGVGPVAVTERDSVFVGRDANNRVFLHYADASEYTADIILFVGETQRYPEVPGS